MFHQTLHEGWHLSATTGPVPRHIAGQTVVAHVPGSAHLDLLAAGLIHEPYVDRVEEELAWMHRTGWRYALEFDAEVPANAERTDLAFDGLDTVASIELNGHTLGTTSNMHRSYRFDVRESLRSGRNELVVSFTPALEYAEDIERKLGERPRAYPHPFNMIRKMACSFGWDWGPDLQTAGIWKPVRCERWATARLARVRPLSTVSDDGSGRIEVCADIERATVGDDAPLVLVVQAGGRVVRVDIPPGQDRVVATLEIPDAALWWPTGYGDQPMYDLIIELRDRTNTRLDIARRRIGMRTIEVDTTPDEIGTPFTVVVNGKPLFVKGANWIPDDHFLTRITRERLAHRVDQALGAHINLLRVWGGGIYETDDFYDVCDERGMLVWQDFPFACAAYPEDEPLRCEVEAEARENVVRLVSHPSLALWNGANENMWGYCDWGWREKLGDRTWGFGYYTDLLPRIVAEEDPTRFYSANSPYSPHLALDQVHPNDQNHGTRHEWQVWNAEDYTAYRRHVPRFCSEFGFQAPPSWATLKRWIHDDPLTPTSPAFTLHQKAEDGTGKLDRGFAPHLPRPVTFDDWHWTTQLNQARAVAFAIEHFRSWWPRTAGAIVWQLNDCWPVTSWAAIDGDGRRKPLWYALRRAYAPRVFTIQPRDEGPVLIAINDSDDAWTGTVHAERQGLNGTRKAAAAIEFDIPSRSVANLELSDSLLTAADPAREVIVASDGETRCIFPFVEDLEVAYEHRALTARAAAVDGGYQVDVDAMSFVRDLALFADRIAPDAETDDMLVSLLAGERHSFFVRSTAEIDPVELTKPPVLRSVNDLAGREDPHSR